MDYLQVLAQADRALVIHGNYLSDDEQAFLASHAERVSVVYCPRTHAHFGHDRYPLSKMLARGVHVALGTDSRASNPDLNLFAEMRFIYRHHQQVDPADIVRLGTMNGARSLGIHNRLGSMAVGKLADFTSIGLAAVADDDPFDLLLGSPFPTQRLCLTGPNVVSRPTE
jgi:cytosine/adenosine deaminase-related metal-dependent hydrolase